MHMTQGLDPWIIVEHAERQAVHVRPRVERADEVGATHRAEAPVRARRGFVVADEIFASRPAELHRLDFAPGAKSRAVRLAAHRAMAVQGIADGTVDLER